MYDLPDARGHFGPYGGIFVAETLTAALEELLAAYERARQDPAFEAEFRYELKHYVGRPSPIYFAKRLTEQCGGVRRAQLVERVRQRLGNEDAAVGAEMAALVGQVIYPHYEPR